MTRSKRSTWFVLICMACIFFPLAAMAAVTVYGEGAYTSTDVVVYIYADISGEPLGSFGVKITGISSGLAVASAEKNEAVWYMGDGTTN